MPGSGKGRILHLVTKTDVAAQLEAEAEEYPEERYEILLEAAEARRRAGNYDRAAELLHEVIGAGGEDGLFARCQLVELRFAEGADEAAYAELDRLAHEPELTDGPCQIVAELLAERGDLRAAAAWYDRAVARLSDEQIKALHGPDPWLRMEAIMLRGRRDVRHKLGLSPDAMDEISIKSPPPAPADVEELRERLAGGMTPPRQVRMLVFRRDERAIARRQWPDVYSDPDEDYYPAAERRWRELVEEGVSSIRVMPVTVAGLIEYAERIGGSPTDPEVKSAYSRTFPPEATLAWPPPRNSACWCGSGAKYKKCCGRAG